MPVKIDHAAEPRSPDALADLVDAVTQASPSDELDWVEWKSGLDLRDRPTQGTIARHILGMANRRPDQARLHAQGCGYLVIGAEPENHLPGVTVLDPAELARLRPLRDWLAQYEQMWNERLGRIDDYLKELQKREKGEQQ